MYLVDPRISSDPHDFIPSYDSNVSEKSQNTYRFQITFLHVPNDNVL